MTLALAAFALGSNAGVQSDLELLRDRCLYFSVGHASRCFSYIRLWVEKKIRRLLATARQRQGFGWKRWSSCELYEGLGLFGEYRVAWQPATKASPA